ncbi:hypothetical protein EK21DRAFT_119699 [Setomelanomma holmii]|uniref:Fork-head domain-containing protein n=1 Tax=Setomelanomma holmii TaxID=210430 RepID=A0A9P4GVF3_9PLEO|nr:hypothetical protein EK21DRAFT_119699 [Setomelanomma holmii]
MLHAMNVAPGAYSSQDHDSTPYGCKIHQNLVLTGISTLDQPPVGQWPSIISMEEILASEQQNEDDNHRDQNRGLLDSLHVHEPVGAETLATPSSDVSKQSSYAELIHAALSGASEHTMTQEELYEWFETKTSKTNGKSRKTWMNSIRSSLRTNPAFAKIKHWDARQHMWRLTEDAHPCRRTHRERKRPRGKA